MAHIGHPTVSDGKYSSLRSFKEDLTWSPRHFLHRCSPKCRSEQASRYRLIFHRGERHEVMASVA